VDDRCDLRHDRRLNRDLGSLARRDCSGQVVRWTVSGAGPGARVPGA